MLIFITEQLQYMIDFWLWLRSLIGDRWSVIQSQLQSSISDRIHFLNFILYLAWVLT